MKKYVEPQIDITKFQLDESITADIGDIGTSGGLGETDGDIE